MRREVIAAIVCVLALLGCHSSVESSKDTQIEQQVRLMSKELIVLATPPNKDSYYAGVMEDIFAFHVGYVEQARDYDDIIILAGSDYYEKYVAALGEGHVVRAEMQDIWIRDFSTSNAVNPMLFRYTSAGQGGGRKGQREADFVQERFATYLEGADIGYGESDWLNDGGNFVDDYAGNVVISRKFLRDNGLNEEQGRAAIQRSTGAKTVAFIEADEQGGLEHADGVVAFIGENTLVMNSYPEDPDYSAKLKTDLRQGLPNVIIHEIVTPYDGSQIYDERFGSACGLYTNMLVTPERIYFPQFGIPEDAHALKQIRGWTDRKVIPVQSSQVCQMGGGVRCMSWQLRGEGAKAFLSFAQSG
jgi:agmatine/peptidylarginine deiminase